MARLVQLALGAVLLAALLLWAEAASVGAASEKTAEASCEAEELCLVSIF